MGQGLTLVWGIQCSAWGIYIRLSFNGIGNLHLKKLRVFFKLSFPDNNIFFVLGRILDYPPPLVKGQYQTDYIYPVWFS